MALSRNWYCDNNISFSDTTSSLTVVKSFLWAMKALLKGELTGTQGTFGARPGGSLWTCLGSSDGTTGAIDGVDRWGNTYNGAKLVRASAGVAHSWMLLQGPAASGSTQLLIDWGTGTDTTINLFFARTAAFSGGTVSARPTSTTEFGFALPNLVETTSGVVHRISNSVDASGHFWFLTAKQGSGIFDSAFGFCTLINTRAGDLFPQAALFDTRTASRGALSVAAALPNYITTVGICMRGPTNSAGTDISVSCGFIERSATLSGISVPNTADGLGDVWPCWYDWRGGANTQNGIRGQWPDIGYVNAWKPPGDVTPTGTPEQTVVGNVLIPNGGVAQSV